METYTVAFTSYEGEKFERPFLAESAARTFAANLLEVDENSDPCITRNRAY